MDTLYPQGHERARGADIPREELQLLTLAPHLLELFPPEGQTFRERNYNASNRLDDQLLRRARGADIPREELQHKRLLPLVKAAAAPEGQAFRERNYNASSLFFALILHRAPEGQAFRERNYNLIYLLTQLARILGQRGRHSERGIATFV